METAKEDQSDEDTLSEYQQMPREDIQQPYESMASRWVKISDVIVTTYFP